MSLTNNNQYIFGFRTYYTLKLKINNDDNEVLTMYNTAIEKYLTPSEHPDSGFDLFVPENICVEKNDVMVKLNHQVSAVVEKVTEFQRIGGDCVNVEPSGYYMYSRSSISKTPYRLANKVGIIDSGYRGDLIAKLDVVTHNVGTEKLIEKGTRLCQLCSPDLSPFRSVTIVSELTDTERGDGGFGSTGR